MSLASRVVVVALLTPRVTDAFLTWDPVIENLLDLLCTARRVSVLGNAHNDCLTVGNLQYPETLFILSFMKDFAIS